MKKIKIGNIKIYLQLLKIAVLYKNYIILALSLGYRSEILIGANYVEGGYTPALFDICLQIGYLPQFDARGIIFIFEIAKKTLISYKKLKTEERKYYEQIEKSKR